MEFCLKAFPLCIEQFGSTIVERYINKNGQEQIRKVDYQPTLFHHVMPDVKTKYKDIFGKPCVPKKFDSIKSARDWMKRMQDLGQDAMGMDDFKLAYFSDTYRGEIDYDIDRIRVAAIDIEVTAPEFPDPAEAKYPIDAITHYDSIDDKFYVYDLVSNTDPWDINLARRLESEKEVRDLEEDVLDRVVYKCYQTEKELLADYIRAWVANYPAIVTGWYSDSFDIPYIVRRIMNVFGESVAKKLSPFNRINIRKVETDYYGTKEYYNITGISSLDGIELYKKFSYTPQPSYKLDDVAQAETNKSKVAYEGKLSELRASDHQTYITYNIGDVVRVLDIDAKRCFIELVVSVAYYAKINFSNVFSPLKTWDAIIYNSLRETNGVIPENKNHLKMPYPGAFVKEPIISYYKRLLTFDLTSLYPSIIRQVNISPETIVGSFTPALLQDYINGVAPRPSDEFSCSPNGWMYRKDVLGVIPVEIKKVFDQRKAWKKKMLIAEQNLEIIKHYSANPSGTIDKEPELDYTIPFADNDKNVLSDIHETLSGLSANGLKAVAKRCEKKISQCNTAQLNRKISINSLYGALGNEYFRFFDLRNASAITLFGQLAIQWIERKVNEYLNFVCKTENEAYVKYCDTDSIYVCVDNVFELVGGESRFKDDQEWVDFLDNFAKKRMEPAIDKAFRELAEYMNSVEHLMFMDREAIIGPSIGSNGVGSFWTAKKRYAANVWDMEGVRYEKPKLKIMGLETQRSSTPKAMRIFLKECIRTILQDGESALHDTFAKFKKDFSKLDYREVAGVSSANNIAKYSDEFGMPIKGTPYHIKGVLFFNRYIKKFNSPIDPIMEGEKVMILPLKERNPYGSDCVSWVSGTRLPKEFEQEMLTYVDYEVLFNKMVISPLETITKACKMDYEKRASLTDVFDI